MSTQVNHLASWQLPSPQHYTSILSLFHSCQSQPPCWIISPSHFPPQLFSFSPFDSKNVFLSLCKTANIAQQHWPLTPVVSKHLRSVTVVVGNLSGGHQLLFWLSLHLDPTKSEVRSDHVVISSLFSVQFDSLELTQHPLDKLNMFFFCFRHLINQQNEWIEKVFLSAALLLTRHTRFLGFFFPPDLAHIVFVTLWLYKKSGNYELFTMLHTCSTSCNVPILLMCHLMSHLSISF